MSWEVDFQARPFKLALRKTSAPRSTPHYFRPSALPDSTYRFAARRALARLAEENRALRTRPGYRARALPSALAEAILRWSHARWPDR